MSEVLCWCCEHFTLLEENVTEKEKDFYGICKNKRKFCLVQEKVCKEFILKRGLHTERTIPNFCEK